ncbi:MAG TPA: PQQ-binding-like beta-propeller repeat protein [Streptosporangiaceae bacterium]
MVLPVATVAVAVAGVLAAAPGPRAHVGGGTLLSANADWPGYLSDASHTSYNASSTSITTSNLANLQPVWRWQVPPPPNSGPATLWASPVVSAGVVYIGAEDGYFYALNEATRQVIWSDYLGLITPTTCPGTYGVTATATVTNDPGTGKPTVYINAPDGNAYALDAATGTVLWKSVVGLPSTTSNNYYAWGSPLVTGGKVYVGISSDCDNPLVPGGMVAFDQATGTQVAKWIDQPGTKLGGSIWGTPTVGTDGRIYAGTGNGYGGSGQPLYDDSMVALDPNTLHVVDYWQIPSAQQIYDGDFGGSPTLYTANLAGASTDMIGICNKNGYFYAFRQGDLAAGPVWGTSVTEPYPGGSEECVSAAVFDGTRLIVGGGAPTTINGTSYMGSVQALDPATGNPIWQTGLPGIVVGTPTENGSGVVAAATLQSSTGTNGVYLLDAATGTVLKFIPTPKSFLYGQPIFAQNDLLIGTGTAEGLTAYEATSPGSPISAVIPAGIGVSTTDTVTLTGTGFTGTPSVVVSGDGVFVTSVTVVSPTQLKVKMTVKSNASQTARDITVTEPGSPPVADTCTACLTIGPKPSPPTITSVVPSTFAPGAKNVAVTVTGTNFDAGAVVTSHSGISIKSTFVSPTQINLSVSVSSTLAAGTYNLFVTDSDGLIAKCAGCLTVS